MAARPWYRAPFPSIQIVTLSKATARPPAHQSRLRNVATTLTLSRNDTSPQRRTGDASASFDRLRRHLLRCTARNRAGPWGRARACTGVAEQDQPGEGRVFRCAKGLSRLEPARLSARDRARRHARLGGPVAP